MALLSSRRGLNRRRTPRFWRVQLLFFAGAVLLAVLKARLEVDTVLYPPCAPLKNYFWTDCTIVKQRNKTVCPREVFKGMQVVSVNFTVECKRQFVFFHSAIFREVIRFLHIKNVYASSNSLVALEDGLVNFWNSEQRAKRHKKTSAGCYDHLIHIPCYWSKTFGHWICDCLVGIILMPKEIVEKSYVLVQFREIIGKQYLDIINIKQDRIVSHFGEWCYAKNVYIITGDEPFLGHSVNGVAKLAKFLTKRLDLDKIPANRYYLMNREKNIDRHIINFHELINHTRLRFPQHKWEAFNIAPKSAIRSIMQWATVKIIVLHAGSGNFNIPFMKNGSGLCVIMPCSIEYGASANAAQLDIWLLGMSHTHRIYQYNITVNIPWVLTGLQRLIFAVENKRWPKKEEAVNGDDEKFWKPMWNVEPLKKEMNLSNIRCSCYV